VIATSLDVREIMVKNIEYVNRENTVIDTCSMRFKRTMFLQRFVNSNINIVFMVQHQKIGYYSLQKKKLFRINNTIVSLD